MTLSAIASRTLRAMVARLIWAVEHPITLFAARSDLAIPSRPSRFDQTA